MSIFPRLDLDPTLFVGLTLSDQGIMKRNLKFVSHMIAASELTYWGPGSEWLWAFIQTLIVLVSLFFIWRQLRIQNNAHLVSSIDSLREKWDSPSLMKSRLDTCEWVETKDKNFGSLAMNVADFFEKLGGYLEYKALPKELIWHIFSDPIQHYWAILEKNILSLRAQHDDLTIFENFEKLNLQMETLGENRALKGRRKSQEEISSFVMYEKMRITEMMQTSESPGPTKP